MLKEFETVALGDLDDSLFKNRYETKYLFSLVQLRPALDKLSGTYRVLAVDNSFIQEYESLYFDTREFKFYLDHQNGKLNRYKVRFRKYADLQTVFIEVKFKNNKNQTRKWREKISKETICHGDPMSGLTVLTDKENLFINTCLKVGSDTGHVSPDTGHVSPDTGHVSLDTRHVSPDTGHVGLDTRLVPRFMVTYSRLTLIHKKNREKVTIDLNLSYLKDREEMHYKDIVIAEVKQGSQSQSSDFFKVMRELGVSPMRF